MTTFARSGRSRPGGMQKDCAKHTAKAHGSSFVEPELSFDADSSLQYIPELTNNVAAERKIQRVQAPRNERADTNGNDSGDDDVGVYDGSLCLELTLDDVFDNDDGSVASTKDVMKRNGFVMSGEPAEKASYERSSSATFHLEYSSIGSVDTESRTLDEPSAANNEAEPSPAKQDGSTVEGSVRSTDGGQVIGSPDRSSQALLAKPSATDTCSSPSSSRQSSSALSPAMLRDGVGQASRKQRGAAESTTSSAKLAAALAKGGNRQLAGWNHRSLPFTLVRTAKSPPKSSRMAVPVDRHEDGSDSTATQITQERLHDIANAASHAVIRQDGDEHEANRNDEAEDETIVIADDNDDDDEVIEASNQASQILSVDERAPAMTSGNILSDLVGMSEPNGAEGAEEDATVLSLSLSYEHSSDSDADIIVKDTPITPPSTAKTPTSTAKSPVVPSSVSPAGSSSVTMTQIEDTVFSCTDSQSQRISPAHLKAAQAAVSSRKLRSGKTVHVGLDEDDGSGVFSPAQLAELYGSLTAETSAPNIEKSAESVVMSSLPSSQSHIDYDDRPAFPRKRLEFSPAKNTTPPIRSIPDDNTEGDSSKPSSARHAPSKLLSILVTSQEGSQEPRRTLRGDTKRVRLQLFDDDDQMEISTPGDPSLPEPDLGDGTRRSKRARSAPTRLGFEGRKSSKSASKRGATSIASGSTQSKSKAQSTSPMSTRISERSAAKTSSAPVASDRREVRSGTLPKRGRRSREDSAVRTQPEESTASESAVDAVSPSVQTRPHCDHCQATQTPVWRKHSQLPGMNLCNACYAWYLQKRTLDRVSPSKSPRASATPTASKKRGRPSQLEKAERKESSTYTAESMSAGAGESTSSSRSHRLRSSTISSGSSSTANPAKADSLPRTRGRRSQSTDTPVGAVSPKKPRRVTATANVGADTAVEPSTAFLSELTDPPSGLFSTVSYAFTGCASDVKSACGAAMSLGGGSAINWHELLEWEGAEAHPLVRQCTNPVCIIADESHRTLKFLFALAVGVTPLHARWVVDCCQSGKLVLSNPSRKGTLPYTFPVDSVDGRPTRRAVSSPRAPGLRLIPKPMSSRSFHDCTETILVYGSTQFMQMWALILRAAGARKVAMHTLQSTSRLPPCDFIVVEDTQAAASQPEEPTEAAAMTSTMSPQRGKRRRIQRRSGRDTDESTATSTTTSTISSSASSAAGPSQLPEWLLAIALERRIDVVGVEWVIQCLIRGRCEGVDRSSYNVMKEFVVAEESLSVVEASPPCHTDNIVRNASAPSTAPTGTDDEVREERVEQIRSSREESSPQELTEDTKSPAAHSVPPEESVAKTVPASNVAPPTPSDVDVVPDSQPSLSFDDSVLDMKRLMDIPSDDDEIRPISQRFDMDDAYFGYSSSSPFEEVEISADDVVLSGEPAANPVQSQSVDPSDAMDISSISTQEP